MTEIVKAKQAIEIFANNAGSVTIKQIDVVGEEQIVCVEVEDVAKVVDAIQYAAAEVD